MKLFHVFATLATAPDKPICFNAISSAVPAEFLSSLSILPNSFLDLMRLFNVTTFDSPTNAIFSAVVIPDLAMLSNASFKPPAFSGLNASFLDTDNLSNVDFNCEPATSADDSLSAIISIAAVISSNETPTLAAMEPDFSNAVVI